MDAINIPNYKVVKVEDQKPTNQYITIGRRGRKIGSVREKENQKSKQTKTDTQIIHKNIQPFPNQPEQKTIPYVDQQSILPEDGIQPEEIQQITQENLQPLPVISEPEQPEKLNGEIPVVSEPEEKGIMAVATEKYLDIAYDNLPIYEINYAIPNQAYEYSERSDLYDPKYDVISITNKKAEKYLSKPDLNMIDTHDNDTVELPKKEECLGVIFTLLCGPVMFDLDSIKDDWQYSSLQNICFLLDSAYQPIYLITAGAAYDIPPSVFLELYKDVFTRQATDLPNE